MEVLKDLEGQKAIREAVTAVRGAMSTADEDRHRPQFHFRPPARWMNDPNGPILHAGWHHLFYQHNPYGDGWGNMHWGHARSRDLVDWEHLPVALWPSKSRGEDHVYSGSTTLDGQGRPVIFYTSIGPRDPEQWMARPTDQDLISWDKVGPVITERAHGDQKIEEWRDPFIVSLADERIMIVGGRHQGKGVVNWYSTSDESLEKWTYRGILFRHPTMDLIECPNLVRVGEKWVLLTSWGGKIDAFVGVLNLDSGTFEPELSRTIAAGSYASQVSHDHDGNAIFHSWINVGGAVGWTGCMAIPSRLGVDEQGRPTLTPLPSLEALRQSSVSISHRNLDEVHRVESIGRQCEIILDIDPGSASRIEIDLASSGPDLPCHRITYDPAARTLTTPRGQVQLESPSVKLHIFLDHVVMDIFADEGRVSQCMGVSREPMGDDVLVRSIDGIAVIRSLEIHRLRSAIFDLKQFAF